MDGKLRTAKRRGMESYAVHPVYLSLSRPSAPAISARSNIGGVAASATLHSAGVALRLLT